MKFEVKKAIKLYLNGLKYGLIETENPYLMKNNNIKESLIDSIFVSERNEKIKVNLQS